MRTAGIGILLAGAATGALADTPKVVVGQPAPDFVIQTIDGQGIGPRELRGKRALIFMWASW